MAGPERVACRVSTSASRRTSAGEWLGRRAATVDDAATLAELGDETGHLGAREAGDLAQIAAQQALVGLTQAGIGEAAQLGGDPLVGGLAAQGREPEGWGLRGRYGLALGSGVLGS